MTKILNLKEAEEWVKENLFEADSYRFPVDVAVKLGSLIEIDKSHFAIAED